MSSPSLSSQIQNLLTFTKTGNETTTKITDGAIFNTRVSVDRRAQTHVAGAGMEQTARTVAEIGTKAYTQGWYISRCPAGLEPRACYTLEVKVLTTAPKGEPPLSSTLM